MLQYASNSFLISQHTLRRIMLQYTSSPFIGRLRLSEYSQFLTRKPKGLLSGITLQLSYNRATNAIHVNPYAHCAYTFARRRSQKRHCLTRLIQPLRLRLVASLPDLKNGDLPHSFLTCVRQLTSRTSYLSILRTLRLALSLLSEIICPHLQPCANMKRKPMYDYMKRDSDRFTLDHGKLLLLQSTMYVNKNK